MDEMRLLLLLTAVLDLLAPLPLSASEEVCGLSAAEEFSPWIADNFGRLLFPVYNQDPLNVPAVDQNGSELAQNSTKPCRFDWKTANSVCTGRLDQDYIHSLRWASVRNFVVDDYKVEDGLRDPSPPQSDDPTTSNHNGSHFWQPYGTRRIERSSQKNRTISTERVELSDDTYKAAGDIFSQEIGIGMHISIELRPNTDYNGFSVEGDAFSNELKVGWRIQGDVLIFNNNGTLELKANVSTIGSSGWRFTGTATLTGADSTWTWSVAGGVDADFLPTPLAFSGTADTSVQDHSSWKVSGRAIVKPLLIVWSVQAAVTPSTNERITIPGGTFHHVKIKNLMFRNSYFMGDFDKDSFQDVIGLKTITFLDSKLEEVPRLDYLFNNLTELQAVYIQETSMPNIKMGTYPSLPNLELFSFKGSGPLQLDGTSFSWLMESKLTYLNFQDCNINIASYADAVLEPVGGTLRYLDLSYTSLTEEAALEAMLRNLRLTHLSLAGLQLRKVPRTALEHVNSTIKFLTLRGNVFRKVPEENMFSVILDFPNMPELEELDLKRCGINFIEAGVFNGLPALKRLYMAYNNVENVQEGWYGLMPGVVHIDLSWNGVSVDTEPQAAFSVQPGDGLKALGALQIADLSNAVFTYPEIVVKGLPNTTRELSLCNIKLESNKPLEELHLPELTVLDISGNSGIEFGDSLTIQFLFSLTKLNRLHARDNKITNTFFTAVREYATERSLSVITETLTTLDLRGNNIKTLPLTFFSYFPNLEMIDLTGNSITSWSESIMIPSSLKTLKISDNKIETITNTMLKDFLVLSELQIGKNPFQCDCNIQRLATGLSRVDALCSADFDTPHMRGVFPISRDTIERHRKGRSVQNMKKCVHLGDWKNSTDYYCYATGGDEMLLLRNLNMTDLCVATEIATIAEHVSDLSVVYIGIAVIISFALVIAFIYWKWWEIRLLTRAVRNAAILSFLHRDEEELPPVQYSAFVSYSDKDRNWVLEHLLPRLEQWSDTSVCLHERDFQVGLSIMENITSSMERSRNLVLVLSQAFIRSQWCQFELHLAQHRLIESRRDRLLLVLLEPIPTYRKPKTLRYLMRTNTYLEWPGEHRAADIERFWDRLVKALASPNLGSSSV